MIPSLQRFYGGSPQDWFELGQEKLRAFAEMLPILQAQESLRSVTEIGIAFAPKESTQARRLRRQWERIANSAEVQQRQGLDISQMPQEERKRFIESLGFRAS